MTENTVRVSVNTSRLMLWKGNSLGSVGFT